MIPMKRSRSQIYDDKEELGIKPTKKTPFVWFLPSGKLTLKGRSIPEDGSLFFEPLYDWVREYLKNPNESTVLTIELEYLNDITSKYLLRIINDLNSACDHFTVKWRYETGDEDMLELGEILCSSTRASFNFINVE
jgi:hypothetical protein